MSSKVNILPIIGDHFSTLRNASTNRISISDLLTQLGIPLLAAALAIWPRQLDLSNTYGNITAALAIVFGFSFAVTVFVFQLRMQMAEMQISSEQRTVAAIAPQIDTRAPGLVNELFKNCLYAVVLSGFSTLFASIIEPFALGRIGDVILVAVACHLLLVLMMCFKRLHAAYARVSSLAT